MSTVHFNNEVARKLAQSEISVVNQDVATACIINLNQQVGCITDNQLVKILRVHNWNKSEYIAYLKGPGRRGWWMQWVLDNVGD